MPVLRIALPRNAVRHSPPVGLGLSLVFPPVRFSSTLQAQDVSASGDHHNSRHGSGTTSRRRRPVRFPKYLVHSPSKTLALRLKSRTQSLKFGAWKRFDEAARSRSLRLPIMMLQMMFRQDEQGQQTSLSESLCSEDWWRSRLGSLAYKGINKADMEHWLWILAGKDADERIERFVSVDRPKPIFLLFQLLRNDATFHKGSSLISLYDYINRYHVRAKMLPLSTDLPFGAVRRTWDSGLNMTQLHFSMLLHLLVNHYVRLWPSALPAVARLVCSYIAILQLVTKNPHKAYADSCYIFNHALVLFQRKSPINPVFQMRYNWRAQKSLLSMSTKLKRPLLISRPGFRAIRRVMLALDKSPDEQRATMRMVRTWPPYRRDWDGLDEKRGPEDDFSRSVQAGVLMQEAGYAETEHDRALAVLGGVLPSEQPTVQTRSLSPRTWVGHQASLNVYSTWASRVKATRDINEAWHEFSIPPDLPTGERLQPNVQVYAEMFKKLLAGPITESPVVPRPVLPGDAREVFPVNDTTLTAFEKERLRPPSVKALYGQMLANNVRPVGDCLVVLVRYAPSMEAAMRYMHDSDLDKTAIAALQLPRLNNNLAVYRPASARSQQPEPTLEVLQMLPLDIFDAYIYLMCRFQSRITMEAARLGKLQRTGLIHHAVALCNGRLPATLEEGQTFRAPWHNILRTLSLPRVLVRPEDTDNRRFHDLESLALALRIYERVRQAGGVDVYMFDSLCRTVQKCLRWTNQETADSEDLQQLPLLESARAVLVSGFHEMLNVSGADSDTNKNIDEAVPFHESTAVHPATRHNITASTLHVYMRVLGYLGDIDEMTQTMQWILRMWDDDTVLEDAKDVSHSDHGAMGRVMVLFRAFTETRMPTDVLEQVEQQLQELRETRMCTWRWPTHEDADEYVRWQRHDHNAAFWARVRPSAGIDLGHDE